MVLSRLCNRFNLSSDGYRCIEVSPALSRLTRAGPPSCPRQAAGLPCRRGNPPPMSSGSRTEIALGSWSTTAVCRSPPSAARGRARRWKPVRRIHRAGFRWGRTHAQHCGAARRCDRPSTDGTVAGYAEGALVGDGGRSSELADEPRHEHVAVTPLAPTKLVQMIDGVDRSGSDRRPPSAVFIGRRGLRASPSQPKIGEAAASPLSSVALAKRRATDHRPVAGDIRLGKASTRDARRMPHHRGVARWSTSITIRRLSYTFHARYRAASGPTPVGHRGARPVGTHSTR
jgi:hypothetical protein